MMKSSKGQLEPGTTPERMERAEAEGSALIHPTTKNIFLVLVLLCFLSGPVLLVRSIMMRGTKAYSVMFLVRMYELSGMCLMLALCLPAYLRRDKFGILPLGAACLVVLSTITDLVYPLGTTLSKVLSIVASCLVYMCLIGLCNRAAKWIVAIAQVMSIVVAGLFMLCDISTLDMMLHPGARSRLAIRIALPTALWILSAGIAAWQVFQMSMHALLTSSELQEHARPASQQLAIRVHRKMVSISCIILFLMFLIPFLIPFLVRLQLQGTKGMPTILILTTTAAEIMHLELFLLPPTMAVLLCTPAIAARRFGWLPYIAIWLALTSYLPIIFGRGHASIMFLVSIMLYLSVVLVYICLMDSGRHYNAPREAIVLNDVLFAVLWLIGLVFSCFGPALVDIEVLLDMIPVLEALCMSFLALSIAILALQHAPEAHGYDHLELVSGGNEYDDDSDSMIIAQAVEVV